MEAYEHGVAITGGGEAIKRFDRETDLLVPVGGCRIEGVEPALASGSGCLAGRLVSAYLRLPSTGPGDAYQVWRAHGGLWVRRDDTGAPRTSMPRIERTLSRSRRWRQDPQGVPQAGPWAVAAAGTGGE